jgi:hypothetical protein
MGNDSGTAAVTGGDGGLEPLRQGLIPDQGLFWEKTEKIFAFLQKNICICEKMGYNKME